MQNPKFERFENKRTPYTAGGRKVFATLSADAIHAELMIGAKLRAAGFDPGRRYVLLFDRKALVIGLEPDPETGFKVQSRVNNNGTYTSYVISARGFCARFGIRQRLECIAARQDGETWFLQMKKAA